MIYVVKQSFLMYEYNIDIKAYVENVLYMYSQTPYC